MAVVGVTSAACLAIAILAGLMIDNSHSVLFELMELDLPDDTDTFSFSDFLKDGTSIAQEYMMDGVKSLFNRNFCDESVLGDPFDTYEEKEKEDRCDLFTLTSMAAISICGLLATWTFFMIWMSFYAGCHGACCNNDDAANVH